MITSLHFSPSPFVSGRSRATLPGAAPLSQHRQHPNWGQVTSEPPSLGCIPDSSWGQDIQLCHRHQEWACASVSPSLFFRRHKTIGSFQEPEEPWAELLLSWDQTGSPTSHPIILLRKTSSPQASFPMFGFGLLLESSAMSSSQMAKAARASFPRSFPRSFPSSWLRQRHNRGQINRNRGAERQSPGRGQPGLRIKEGEAAALPCSLPCSLPSRGCFRKVPGVSRRRMSSIAWPLLWESFLSYRCSV